MNVCRNEELVLMRKYIFRMSKVGEVLFVDGDAGYLTRALVCFDRKGRESLSV